MKAKLSDIEKRYRQLSDEEFKSIDLNDLIDEAFHVYGRRGLGRTIASV